MTALLLPGTTVMYYGDEIGMANSTDISYDQTVDPYAQEPYCNSTAFENGDCYSRDLARTPMQVNSSAQIINISVAFSPVFLVDCGQKRRLHNGRRTLVAFGFGLQGAQCCR